MEYETRCGTEVPKLGFGTWQAENDVAYEAVTHALEHDYRHIDTAQVYENEEGVGRAIADSDLDREDVFLTTKVWRSNLHAGDVRTAEATVSEAFVSPCEETHPELYAESGTHEIACLLYDDEYPDASEFVDTGAGDVAADD